MKYIILAAAALGSILACAKKPNADKILIRFDDTTTVPFNTIPFEGEKK